MKTYVTEVINISKGKVKGFLSFPFEANDIEEVKYLHNLHSEILRDIPWFNGEKHVINTRKVN
jgi:hypothetical protein